MDFSYRNGNPVPVKRKIAVPVFGHRVSSRLDCSESILLVNIEDGMIAQRQETRWTHFNPLEKIRLLVHEQVDVLICGGLTGTCLHLLHDTDIQVISWVRGDVDAILSQFIQGTLVPVTPQQNNRTSP